MNARRRGLGRGLDALLGSQPASAEDGGALRDVAIDQLEPNRFQPRSHFSEEGLDELAASIRSQGVLQPLVVTESEDGRYGIIAGERRWRAARLAGLEHVPVLVREVADDQQRLELALIENIQRADLDVIEEAEAYRLLAERFGLSQDDIGAQVGKSRPAITNALRLLRLPPEVLDRLRDGQLSAGQARPLLALGDADKQIALASRAVEEGLTARKLEKLVRGDDGAKAPGRKPAEEPDVHTRAATDRLTRELQTRVEIRRRRRGGEVRIHFGSEDELIRLFDRLTHGKGAS